MEDIIKNSDVEIALKDGRRKYGILLDRIVNDKIVEWLFIPNSHYREYLQTKNPALIERVPGWHVAYVDQYFK